MRWNSLPFFLTLWACSPSFTLFVQADEPVQSGNVISLWENGAPGFEDRQDEPEITEKWSIRNVHNPTLTVFLPDPAKATGVGIIVCPGGGLRKLGYDNGGVEPAKYLADELGIAAFVLKYRLPREEGSPYKFELHTKQDGERAVRWVRHHADALGLDPGKIGMMGFSAGGEVVSIVTYRGTKANPNATDPLDQLSSRPDFQVLIYPGPGGIPSKLPPGTPPAFLLIAGDDNHTSVLLNLIARFREDGTPYEAHIFTRGGHGFGMGKRSKRRTIQQWPDRLADWLHDEVLTDRVEAK